MTEADPPRRRFVRIEALIDEARPLATEANDGWKQPFLESLAETSNVSASAEAAGVSVGHVYRLRRQDGAFARAWQAALLEGYEHLEMETLHRLRMGTAKDDPKFDIANALRLLSLHKDTVAAQRVDRDERDEEEIITAIDAKLARIRAREENVTRMLSNEGIGAPRLSDDDE